jgi:hypothetical protein
MKQSTTRILTTHTGSLPRPQDLLYLLIEEQARPGTDRTALDAAIQRVDSKIVWLKLQALSEGARLASQELWGCHTRPTLALLRR